MSFPKKENVKTFRWAIVCRPAFVVFDGTTSYTAIIQYVGNIGFPDTVLGVSITTTQICN